MFIVVSYHKIAHAFRSAMVPVCLYLTPKQNLFGSFNSIKQHCTPTERLVQCCRDL